MKILLLVLMLASCLNFVQPENKIMNVAIFIYDGVELLDFSGPGEVFADAHLNNENAFNVYTVAVSEAPIISQGFATITPKYTINNCPKADIIVIPGGDSRKSKENKEVIQWIKDCAENAKIVMSVCTGAGLLSKAGLLDGKEVTTWHGAIDRLQEATPKAKVHRDTRFVDNGQIITTAGVSARIDGALHVARRLLGEDEALRVTKFMEYDKWKPEEGLIVTSNE